MRIQSAGARTNTVSLKIVLQIRALVIVPNLLPSSVLNMGFMTFVTLVLSTHCASTSNARQIITTDFCHH